VESERSAVRSREEFKIRDPDGTVFVEMSLKDFSCKSFVLVWFLSVLVGISFSFGIFISGTRNQSFVFWIL
jgi:hypothetical protein